MKILIVTQYFWPEYFRVNDLVEELKNRNFEVEILTSYPNYPEGKIFEEFKKDPKKFSKFKNCKIHRVPQLTRGEGSIFRLTLNYISFLISSMTFSLFYLRKKKYDYVFTFATSPITVALISIFICKICKSKHVLWVLDLWPDVLNDLNILSKKNILYKLFSKIVLFIYKRSEIILCQSLTYKRTINILDQEFKKKTWYFPSWPEVNNKISTNNYKIDKNIFSKDKFNIIFTGNIGDAQNFGKVIELANITKDEINWIIIGKGRRFEMIKKRKADLALNNMQLLGMMPFAEIAPYVNNSDALLIALKSGTAFEATIPGKFQTYLNYDKKIIGLIGGEVFDIITKYKIGYATKDNNINKIRLELLNYLKKPDEEDKSIKKKKILRKIFSKERNINKLARFFKIISQDVRLYYIKNASQIPFNDNFILSGFNLAFLGAFQKDEIHITKNFYIWPDGYYFKRITKLNINKLPGRSLLNTLSVPNNIDEIVVIGNLTILGKSYLKEKFNRKITHIDLPYGDLNSFKELIPEFKSNQLCILTLPTPKQEILANYIQIKQKHYKILCLGAAINMLSGQERPLPNRFENIFIAETIWRLQYETKRRISRLLSSFYNYSKGKKSGKYNKLVFKNIDEK